VASVLSRCWGGQHDKSRRRYQPAGGTNFPGKSALQATRQQLSPAMVMINRGRALRCKGLAAATAWSYNGIPLSRVWQLRTGTQCKKTWKAMQDSELRKLDKRSIAIELTVRDQKSVFKGVGHFDDHGKNGPALRVEIQHPLGNFAIQLRTNEWQGEIESGEQFGCEFLLHLNAASLHQDKTLSDSWFANRSHVANVLLVDNQAAVNAKINAWLEA
jgi:hypothetical protein